MELFLHFIMELLKSKIITVEISNMDINKMFEDKCYLALREIKYILSSKEKSDSEQLDEISHIVEAYRTLKINPAHNFLKYK